MSSIEVPTINEIKSARKKLGEKVRYTPVWQWKGDEASRHFGESTEIFLKLKLSGSANINHQAGIVTTESKTTFEGFGGLTTGVKF